MSCAVTPTTLRGGFAPGAVVHKVLETRHSIADSKIVFPKDGVSRLQTRHRRSGSPLPIDCPNVGSEIGLRRYLQRFLPLDAKANRLTAAPLRLRSGQPAV